MKSKNTKRYIILILSATLLICTTIVLLSVDSIVDNIMELYRSLISALPDNEGLDTLLSVDTLKKCYFADIAILYIIGLISLYVASVDKIKEKRTLLIACLIIAIFSCIDVVSLIITVVEFILILTMGGQDNTKRSKKATIKKLED